MPESATQTPEIARALERAIATIRAGSLEEAERILVALIPRARGRGDWELRAVNTLAAVYGRSGRVFESLVLSRQAVALARDAGNTRREIKALSGVCVGRYGLYIGADFSAELARLRHLMLGVPVDESTRTLHMEIAYVEFAHALVNDDLDAAEAHIDTFFGLSPRDGPEAALAHCVDLACRALIAIRAGRADDANRLLDELDAHGNVSPYHAPELRTLRVQARVAVGDLDAARRDGMIALRAIEEAPEGALSYCIHFGSQLAEALHAAGDIDGAHRAYDLVATAVVRRLRQLDACMKALPQLGFGSRDDATDLVRYRRRFVSGQREILSRVGALFHTADVADLRSLIETKDGSGYVAICAWCESLRDEDGRWLAAGHLVPRDGPFRITHGICTPCADGFRG